MKRSIEQFSKYNYKHYQMLMVLVLILFGSQCRAIIIIGDTSKTNYPINDPRNPNCPCHQYQKIADDEYNRMLDEQKGISEDPAGPTSQTKTMVYTEVSNARKDHAKHQVNKFKRRKTGIKQKKLKRIKHIRHWNIVSRFKDPTACFTWR